MIVVVHYPPPGGRAPLGCLARLESDYSNDIRLATNGNLLTMGVPRDLINRPRVFVLGHESAVLQQGITSAGFYEQKKSKTIQAVPRRGKCRAGRRCYRWRHTGPRRVRKRSSRHSRSRAQKCTSTCRHRRPTTWRSSRTSSCGPRDARASAFGESLIMKEGWRETYEASKRGPLAVALPASGCHAI